MALFCSLSNTDIFGGCNRSTTPFDLEISVSPHGGIDEWQWTLSIGNGAPIEIGVVKGSRMDGIRVAGEERLRLIGKARKPPDDPPRTP
jgi:hypothetical protein